VSVCSLLRAVRRQSSGVADGVATGPGQLLVVLGSVADPRARRGVRHRVGAVLTAAVCAVLAGARSYTAIAEWARELPLPVRAWLGLGRRSPSESTIRRVLQRLDADALDRALGAWLTGQPQPVARVRRVIAVDGKTVRGARRGKQRAVHLLGAFDPATGTVLA